MKKSPKVILCATVYIAAIAGLSVVFTVVGEPGNAPGTISSGEVPAYQAPAGQNTNASLTGWTAEPSQGEEHWISPGGSARFIVKRAAAYQEDLEAYAKANVSSIEMERVEELSALACGEIGGRQTYVYAYADFGQKPVQYRKIYIFNTNNRTYGAMGVTENREALEEIGFDSIVAGYQFE